MTSADLKLFWWINGLAGRVEITDRLIKGLVNDYFTPACLALGLVWLWFAAKTASQRKTE